MPDKIFRQKEPFILLHQVYYIHTIHPYIFNNTIGICAFRNSEKIKKVFPFEKTL